MLKEKKAPETEYDYCVLCGKKIEYKKNVPVNQRNGYVEGGGQLCEECYKNTYQKGKDCFG